MRYPCPQTWEGIANSVLTQSASLTTWTTQLSTLEKRAAEHDRFSAELVSQLADPLKATAARYEELRKSHSDYAARLDKEKEAALGLSQALQ